MNGGKIISPRVLYPRFGEAVGKVFGVDWLFGLDETDPWVKTYAFFHSPHTIARSVVYFFPHSWRANSNVVRNWLRSPRKKIDNLSDRSQVFHASYVLHVVSKRADQTLVPMRNFIVGSADLQTQRPTLSEPRRDDFTVGASPPAKLTNSSVPLDAPKISRRVSPLRSPPREFRLEKSPYARRPNTPPSIGLAKQNTLVDPLVQHDSSKQPKRDSTFSQTPLAAAPVPFYHDCPRIDLVALVREKQKAKKLKKMKLSVPPLQKVQRRRVIPRDSSYERFR